MQRKFVVKASTNNDVPWSVVQKAAQAAAEDKCDLFDDVEEKYGLSTIEQQVEDIEDVFVEPSVQGGHGTVFFYYGDDYVTLDYQEYLDYIIEMILESNSIQQFERAYQGFIQARKDWIFDMNPHYDDEDYDDEDYDDED